MTLRPAPARRRYQARIAALILGSAVAATLAVLTADAMLHAVLAAGEASTAQMEAGR